MMILGIDNPFWKVLSDISIILFAILLVISIVFLIAWLWEKSGNVGLKPEDKYFIKAAPLHGYYVMERYPRIVHNANHITDKRQIAFVDTISEARKIIRRLTSSIYLLEKEEQMEEEARLRSKFNQARQKELMQGPKKKHKQIKIQTYEEWTEELEGVRGWNEVQHRNNLSKYLEYLTIKLRKEIHDEY